jgi:hypothetical protein
MSFSLYALIAASVALAVFRLSKIGHRPKEFPPGPPTWPLIGNLHLMPKEKAHLQFQKWAQEYGPVYSLMLGTKVMIVLSSDQAIKDLLDKRSGIYSSRPDMYLGKVVSGGYRMLLMVNVFVVAANRWRSVLSNSFRNMEKHGECSARSFTTT